MNKKGFMLWMVNNDFTVEEMYDMIHKLEEMLNEQKDESIIGFRNGHPYRIAITQYCDESEPRFWTCIFPKLSDIKQNREFLFDLVTNGGEIEDFFSEEETDALVKWFKDDNPGWPISNTCFDFAEIVNELGECVSFD